MAELTRSPERRGPGSACCSTEAQADCCEPTDKAECCAPESSSCGCSAGEASGEEIREAVRTRYAAAATSVSAGAEAGASCCAAETVLGEEEAKVFGAGLYGEGEQGELPDTATMASLGCGNPTAVAELDAGEIVLDLGSGGGIDVLLSARRVGPTGKAYGLDMTDEMLALARENQRKAGVENVEWLRGQIEAIPLPAETVDVVISNCVINLSGDKPSGARRGRPRPQARRALRRLRRDRRRGHGRGDPRRHGASGPAASPAP